MKITCVAVDFDGTIVENLYPGIGLPVPQAVSFLQQARSLGAILILYTRRKGRPLEQAREVCRALGLDISYVNSNPHLPPSDKIAAHIYVDDAALGAPLMDAVHSPKKMLNWAVAGPLLLGYIRERAGRT